MTAVPPSPDDPSAIAAAKRALRERARRSRRAARDRIGGATAAAQLAAWADTLAAWPVDGARVVAGYWPIGDEIDPRPLMAALAGRGWRTALPVVVESGHPLIFRRWTEGDPLVDGPCRTVHPGAAAAEVVPTLLLVPLLAFDKAGRRLGWGGGFYDRTLEGVRRRGSSLAVGVAFSAQGVAEVPSDPHDQRLDGVLTETGWVLGGPTVWGAR